MTDKLAPLCLLPPTLDTSWIGLAPHEASHKISRRNNKPLELATPLFWFDPPWHLLPIETADALADAVARVGITVSALHRDVSAPDSQSNFFTSNGSGCAPRMLPYRPERYGLSPEDFDDCGIVDVRLNVCRDATGAHVYSQSQIQRWEATTDASPVAGGSWVPATTFPPDVESPDHLGPKLSQLRSLAPGAAIFISLGPFRLVEELKRFLAQQSDGQRMPDGVIVRLDQATLTPLKLAQQTLRLRKLVDEIGEKGLPLWIAPENATPDDAARLIALGASGVAVDSWCDEFVEELANPSEAMAASFGYHANGIVISGESARSRLNDWVSDVLTPMVARFNGLCRSLHPDPAMRLCSFDREWSKALGVKYVGL